MPGAGREKFMRIVSYALDAHLKMQMCARRAAGRTHISHTLASLDDVANIYMQLRSVCIAGNDVVAVINFQHVAVFVMIFCRDDNPAGGGHDGSSIRCRKIDSFVDSATAGKRVEANAKT